MNSIRPTIHAALALVTIAFVAASPPHSARADMIELAPTTDFTVEVTSGVAQPPNENETTLFVNQDSGFDLDGTATSVLKFDLSSIPTGSIIDSANLIINITSNASVQSAVIDVIGFLSTNEDALASDGATQPGEMTLGSFNPIFDENSISLSQTTFQTLFDASSLGEFLAIRLQSPFPASATVDIELSALDANGLPTALSPTLQVNFTPAAVPEPTSTTLLGLMAIAGGFTGWRQSRGLTKREDC